MKERAEVHNQARIYGNAIIMGRYTKVTDDARVYGGARVSGGARVEDRARVYGDARVSGEARVKDHARVYGGARVSGGARVEGRALVYGDARVSGGAKVYGSARVYGDAVLDGGIEVDDGEFNGLVEYGRVAEEIYREIHEVVFEQLRECLPRELYTDTTNGDINALRRYVDILVHPNVNRNPARDVLNDDLVNVTCSYMNTLRGAAGALVPTTAWHWIALFAGQVSRIAGLAVHIKTILDLAEVSSSNEEAMEALLSSGGCDEETLGGSEHAAKVCEAYQQGRFRPLSRR